jgi:DNA-binding TFAR19-related protein (PDSD5 family)
VSLLSEDDELEMLKRRRLLEMQRRLLMNKALEAEKKAAKEEKPKEPEEILKSVFEGRAWEVWNAAKTQYPEATKQVASALASLIESKKLKEKITGEQLVWLYRQMNLPIRLETKIRILESGELKTIAQKLKGD